MASASKGEAPSKRIKAKSAKKAVNSTRWREGMAEELKDIEAAKPVAERKPTKTRGVLDPGIVTIPRDGKVGRPAIAYTDELDEQLFEYVASGLSLEKISRIEGMPSVVTLLKWASTKSHKFADTYVRAKELLVTLYEERALEIATTPQYGEITVSRSGEKSYTETREVDMVERSRLAFNAYQWTLSHMAPKKHSRQATPADASDVALDELLGEFRERNGKING